MGGELTIRMRKPELLSENEAGVHARFRATLFWFRYSCFVIAAYCGGIFGIAGWIGFRLSALMPVESRALW
jgi:hypothetical protein